MNTLKLAVIEQLGYDSDEDQELIDLCTDITVNGIDGGYGQFVYYSDTSKFYEDNKADIIDLLKNLCEDIGEPMSRTLASFNCVNATETECELFFMGLDDEFETEIKNALAWFAAEEIAREISNA